MSGSNIPPLPFFSFFFLFNSLIKKRKRGGGVGQCLYIGITLPLCAQFAGTIIDASFAKAVQFLNSKYALQVTVIRQILIVKSVVGLFMSKSMASLWHQNLLLQLDVRTSDNLTCKQLGSLA